MIIDVVTYNGEHDLWDIHYNVLKNYVDQFIVCESPTTFSGKKKPLYFNDIKDKYNVLYHINDEDYSPENIFLAENSPNTKGATHWKREFLQKESIKNALTHLKDDDVVFIGDVDEVWIWSSYVGIMTVPTKLRLKVYTYYLNNRSSEEFYGTLVSRYKDIKDSCLNHLRTSSRKTRDEWGWHFTSMGGVDEVRRKLSDSYTQESYFTQDIDKQLEYNIQHKRDFLGRKFTYWTDESEWPLYLKENRAKYTHLLC